jgi:hypothetical protein
MTAEQCEGQEQSFVAGYAQRAAEGVERLGGVLERKDLSEMVHDLERVCRERPLLVGGAALLAGFIGTRLARTAVSAQREHNEPEPEYEEITGGDEATEVGFDATRLKGEI